MAFRILPNGTIEADSAEEAVAVSRRLASRLRHAAADDDAGVGSRVPPATDPGDARIQSNSADGWSAFIARLGESKTGDNQKKILLAIKQRGRTPISALPILIGMQSTTELSGTLAGITKNARSAGLKKDDVLVFSVKGYGKTRKVSYDPGRLLKQASEDDLR